MKITPVLLAVSLTAASSLAAQGADTTAFVRFEASAPLVARADSLYAAKAYAAAAAANIAIAERGDWTHPGDLRYNAACSDALAGKPEFALTQLRLAIAAGYRDAPQLESDPDLTTLHARPEWRAVVREVEDSVAAFRRTHSDPERARLVTTDIPRFWRVYDLAQQVPAADRPAIYRREYFAGGSIGLADYFLVKIRSVNAFAAFIDRTPRYYQSIRSSTMQVASDVSAIRTVLRRMKQLYPAAVFPDIYFVVGRLTSGGTSTATGLLLGSEMFAATPMSPRDEIGPGTRDFISNASVIPTIVAHELVHFEQHMGGKEDLLRNVLVEG
ncbi:MAG: TPR end-of-group domain-containing protein, partial [Gemmatimonadales bacterium]